MKALLRHQAERARDYYARAARALPRGDRAPPGGRRDHGRDLPRAARADRAARLRRVLARGPDAAAAARAHRRGDLGADRAPPVTSRYRRHRDRRRLRRPERGRRAGRRGARVLVLDARPQLGGRATAFRDRETGELVDNGQHVLFGCYRETFGVPGAIGAADQRARAAGAGARVLDRERPPLRAALPAAAGAAAPAGRRARRGTPMPWRDRLAVLRLALPAAPARRHQLRAAQTIDGPIRRNVTVRSGSISHGQSAHAAASGCGIRWRWRR